MANRKRNIPMLFWVTEEEKELIQQKMENAGIHNMSAYLRKMAIDGYTVRLDIPELKSALSILRHNGNNLNQLTKRVHEIGRIYDADILDLKQRQEKELDAIEEVVRVVSVLK